MVSTINLRLSASQRAAVKRYLSLWQVHWTHIHMYMYIQYCVWWVSLSELHINTYTNIIHCHRLYLCVNDKVIESLALVHTHTHTHTHSTSPTNLHVYLYPKINIGTTPHQYTNVNRMEPPTTHTHITCCTCTHTCSTSPTNLHVYVNHKISFETTKH